ncbi:MAG TPA: hypothetical protein VH394_31285, partial [Thermoanaerobaculia bacterium]|nr:hypothetical protein [Thermoanaerobaculia bacterium]
MESLRIDRLEARYRLPLSRREESQRLDRTLRLVLDEALERALERLGYPLHEEICIREIHAPVRLRLSADDDELALAWSLALARSLGEAVREGRTDQVARYGSRAQALVDFAAGVARGDLRRAWAWSQLGFGPVSDGFSFEEAGIALERTLLREGASIVPVLRALAEEGLTIRLVRRLPAASWLALAEEALGAAGARAAAEALYRTPPASDVSPEPVETLLPELRRVRRAVRVSPLARMVLAESSLPPEVRSALAVLAMLDADPALLRRASAAGIRALVEAAVRASVLEESAEPSESAPSLSRAGSRRERKERETGPAATGTLSRASATRTASEATPVLSEPSVSEPAPGLSLSETDPPEPAEDLALPVRASGETRRGGLLFLVSVLDDLG